MIAADIDLHLAGVRISRSDVYEATRGRDGRRTARIERPPAREADRPRPCSFATVIVVVEDAEASPAVMRGHRDVHVLSVGRDPGEDAADQVFVLPGHPAIRRSEVPGRVLCAVIPRLLQVGDDDMNELAASVG